MVVLVIIYPGKIQRVIMMLTVAHSRRGVLQQDARNHTIRNSRGTRAGVDEALKGVVILRVLHGPIHMSASSVAPVDLVSTPVLLHVLFDLVPTNIQCISIR
jgi:hypothetical protein